VPIDRYITTGCGDIAEIVDLLGGIPVTMPYPITFEADKNIPQGEQILTGAQAEWLLRFRHDYTEGDIGRMKAQRIFMAAAMRKVSGMGRLRLLQVIRSITEQKLIGSDLTVDEIAKLGDFASSRSAEQFTVHLLPGEGYNYQPPVTHGITSYSVWMMHKQPVTDLLNQYFRPYFEPEADLPVADLLTPAEYQYTGYDSDSTDFQKLENGETFMGN
jgi:anionic cell wall polymer biosynthesis LytR-Cps2A-Psr (LCP) family protein